MEIFRRPNLKDIGRIGAGVLLAASALAPTSINAGEAIILTPPEGSVTPGASGFVEAEVLSTNPDNLVTIHLTGNLTALIPGRVYQPWVCWDTPADCSTQGGGVQTDQQGSASFDEVVTVFNRPNHPIASIRIAQVTSGAVPPDACFLVSNPCLSTPYSVNQ